MNKRQSINEYYIGETPGVREIYNCIHVLRTKYKITEKKITPLFIDDGINCSPEMIKLNRAVEKEFGFNPFSIIISMDRRMNACTFRIPGKDIFNIDYNRTKYSLHKNKKGGGLSYNPADHNGCLIMWFYGLFFNPRFTDREMTAILLHEIGHNFASYASKTVGNLSLIGSFFELIAIVINTLRGNYLPTVTILIKNNKWLINTITFMTDLIQKTPILSHVINAFTQIINLNISFMKDLRFTMGLISLYPRMFGQIIDRLIENLITFPYQMAGYQEERFSDSFAVMYGYGEDLAMALNKMQSEAMINMTGYSYSFINEIPIIGHLLQLYYLPYRAIMDLFDVHPTAYVRVNEITSQLRKELRDSKLDPKTKKEIENQIHGVEINVEKYNKSIKGYNPRIIQAIWLTMMYYHAPDDSMKSKIIDSLSGYDLDADMKATMKDLKFQ